MDTLLLEGRARCAAAVRSVRLWVSGFRGLGFRVKGFRVWGFRGLGFRVLGFRGLGFRMYGCRVWGLGFRVYLEGQGT